MLQNFLRVSMLVLLLSACAGEPDEQALQRVMTEMETAIEAGDSGDFLEHISPEFSGQAGAMDARQLRGTLAALTLRHEKIGINVLSAPIKLFDDRATVTLEVLATGGSWMPDSGQMLEIESHWRRIDGEWQCFSAEWKARW